MTIAVASTTSGEGVTVVEVNLKFVWDLVSRIGIGPTGHAYVVDRHGQLLSHPDISRVLQQSDFSGLPQVRGALAALGNPDDDWPDPGTGRDPRGNPVLAASVPIAEYRLVGEETGIQVIRRLCLATGTAIPAALISGDTAAEALREAKASGYLLLTKPVAAAKLRALIEHLVSAARRAADDAQGSAG